MTEEIIFAHAIDLPQEQRAAYLDQVCAGDADLRARVEKLLRSHEEAGSFLSSPVDLDGTLPLTAGERQTIAERAAEQEGDVIGPYKLLQQIGVGGFGSVWMAHQI